MYLQHYIVCTVLVHHKTYKNKTNTPSSLKLAGLFNENAMKLCALNSNIHSS